MDLFDTVHVYQDSGRTFHPKVYAIEGPEHATFIIGSGNLTKGGLFTNYEAACLVDLDLHDNGDVSFLNDVRAFYTALKSDPACCKPLTEQLLEDLAADPTLVIYSEADLTKPPPADAGSGLKPLRGGGGNTRQVTVPSPNSSDAATWGRRTAALTGSLSSAEPQAPWGERDMEPYRNSRTPEDQHVSLFGESGAEPPLKACVEVSMLKCKSILGL
jgi:hypothetical protein